MTSAAGANPPPRVPDPVRGGLRRWLREAKPMARLLVRPLWHWIVRYAFLAAMTAILMGIVANWFLWQLGLPYLFAVGTPVARRPPHRSEHAELPHSAPASGQKA